MEQTRDVEALIEGFRPMVYAVARTFGGTLAGDPDLLQCGMIGLWRAAERWDGVRPFPPLAKVCIRHAMVDHLRRICRWEEPVDLTGEQESLAGERFDLPDEQSIDRAICAAFPRDCRERQVLRSLLAGRSKEYIARRCGTSRKQVSELARRAWKEVDLCQEQRA